MRKLVLGIVVVGILHFAFVAFLRLQDPATPSGTPVETAALPAVAPEPPPAEPAAAADPDSLPAAAITRMPARDPFFKPDRGPERAGPRRLMADGQRARPERVGVRRPSIPTARPDDFATIVIGYGYRRAPRDYDRCDATGSVTRFIAAAPSAPNKVWAVIRTIDPRIN